MAIITQDELKSILHYEPETGIWTWLVNSGKNKNKGKIAGSLHKRKSKTYIGISINNKIYLSHRLAYFYMTGEWPSNIIDHEDRDGLNNKWDNIRDCTYSQNNYNMKRRSKKGLLPGIQKIGNKYCSKIKCNNRQIYLGLFNTDIEAHERYLQAKKYYHGNFAYIETITKMQPTDPELSR